MIITSADFKEGVHKIAFDQYTRLDLEDLISKEESNLMVRLLGIDLWTLFQADLVNGVPQTQIYIDLYEPFTIEIGGCLVISKGIKEYLKGAIYFLYMREVAIKATPNGAVKANHEVSTTLTGNTYASVLKLNESKNTGLSIQFLADSEPTIYPTFKGYELMEGEWL